MRKGLLLLGILLICAQAPAASQVWEWRDSRWQTVDQPSATQPAADPVLDEAQSLLHQRQSDPARKLVRRWLKAHKEGGNRDRAIFLMAEACFQEDDRIKAFYYLDELMDEYPQSALFQPALARQYEIADAFLNGYKRKFLGIRMLGTHDEAVEMMYRIQQRSPGSPLAEKALLRTADYYYADAQYDVAADAYRVYGTSYPRSPKVPRTRLRQAFANYAQFRGLRFDLTPLLDARTQLVDLIADYPDLAKQENLLPLVERIDNTFARKLYATADFYRRTSEPAAAVYTYRFLISTYPNAPEAQLARRQLAKMPDEALNQPEPRPGRQYIPIQTSSAD